MFNQSRAKRIGLFHVTSQPVAACSRIKALRKLYQKKSGEARGLLLMRDWLSPNQRKQFDNSGYFDVVGCDSGKRYRIYHGMAPPNVYEIDDAGRLKMGLCFMPIGRLVAREPGQGTPNFRHIRPTPIAYASTSHAGRRPGCLAQPLSRASLFSGSTPRLKGPMPSRSQARPAGTRGIIVGPVAKFVRRRETGGLARLQAGLPSYGRREMRPRPAHPTAISRVCAWVIA